MKRFTQNLFSPFGLSRDFLRFGDFGDGTGLGSGSFSLSSSLF